MECHIVDYIYKWQHGQWTLNRPHSRRPFNFKCHPKKALLPIKYTSTHKVHMQIYKHEISVSSNLNAPFFRRLFQMKEKNSQHRFNQCHLISCFYPLFFSLHFQIVHWVQHASRNTLDGNSPHHTSGERALLCVCTNTNTNARTHTHMQSTKFNNFKLFNVCVSVCVVLNLTDLRKIIHRRFDSRHCRCLSKTTTQERTKRISFFPHWCCDFGSCVWKKTENPPKTEQINTDCSDGRLINAM